MSEGNNNGLGSDNTTVDRHVSIGDAASILGVSIDTVRRWEKAGKVTAQRLDGKNRYFNVAELEQFKANQPLSSTEVAKLLGVSASTVRRLDAEGKLSATRSEKGKRLYDRKRALAYAASRSDHRPSESHSEGIIGSVVETMADAAHELDIALQNELETLKEVEQNQAGSLMSANVHLPFRGWKVAFYLLIVSFGVIAFLANTKFGTQNFSLLGSLSRSESSKDTASQDGNINLQGYFAEQEPGNLAMVPITSNQIKDGSIEGVDIAAGSIGLTHLSSDLQQQLGEASNVVVASIPGPQGIQGEVGPPGAQGAQGAQGVVGPAGPASSITDITAGNGLVGGGSSGSVSLSIQNCGSANQILKWNGSTWQCDTDNTTGFTGTWAVADGGTGATSFTSNGILYGNGTGALQSTSAGTSGQIILANASGTPTFTTVSGDASLLETGALSLASTGVVANTYGSSTQVPVFTVDAKGRLIAVSNTTITGVTPGGSAGGDLSGTYPNPSVVKINGNDLGSTTVTAGNILLANGSQWASATLSGDITINGSGVTTVQANSIALGTDTTGNYVASLTAGNGISISGTAGEAWSPSVAVLYGSTLNTAAQGNTVLSFTGSGNLTGSVTGTAGGGFTTNTLNVVSNPAFSTVAATTFTGALSGNASTATALQSNPSDCAVNQFASSIDASGNLTCAAITKSVLANSGTLGFTWADSEVTDTLTIGASSTVADAALSANVTKLGTSIQNAEVDDDLTISASGSVADAALSANITKLGGSIDLVTEVTGILRASSLQNVATDLGAANVDIILSNSNGSFVTNLTTDGTITASTFAGALTGNASTASALLSDPVACTSSRFVTDVAANGTLSCALLTDADVPDTITLNLSGATGTLADARLSSNVTLLGSTVTKDEITGMGTLAFSWADSEINDTLTASVFKGSGTVTDAVDLATAEIAGALGASNGGTGLSSISAGDMLVGGAGNSWAKLAAVAAGSCLVSSGVGAAPVWGSCAAGGGITGTGTANTLAMFTSTGVVGNSTLAQSGTTLQLANGNDLEVIGGDVIVTGNGSFTGNVAAASFSGSGASVTGVNAAQFNSQAASYYLNASNLNAGTLNIARIANGDITNAKLANSTVTVTAGTGLTGGGSVVLGASTTVNLADTTVAANSYGAAGSVATFTVNAQGRLTAANTTAIAIGASQVTSGTLAASRGGTGIDTSAATGIATLSSGTWSIAASLGDAQISDALTIGASSTVADAALSANVTKLGTAVDLATSEVSGRLQASNFQNAAADLGAADVNINFSNTNGSFNTNLTTDGTVTAGSFSGNLTGNVTGNASTATALFGDPADCGANTFATTIAASGALTCSAVSKTGLSSSGTLGFTWSDTEVSDTLTSSIFVGSGSTTSSVDLATAEINGILADGNVTDTLTIGASSTVADAALSANVTKLGTSIQNAEVDDDLTISASGSVADGALSANVTKLGSAIDLATGEVSGNLKASNLQSGAVDLGAADVTINLSNSNSSFNTNLILDGSVTAGSFIGSLTGNASTATTLAADPTDCAANTFANTIANSGNLTCSAVNKTSLSNTGTLGFTWGDGEIADTLTIGASSTIADAALSSNVTKLGTAIDLATSEVSGNLKALNLQVAAADLGAADVNLNLSNTNGSFNTNLTIDGILTAASFSGSFSGNATTATALAADPADCSANQFATAINASGTLTCAALTDAAVPDTLTIGASSTVADAALSANVSKLGTSIQNAEVDDDLTISASGSVADGALSVNITKLGSSIDLATGEVSGNLKASSLQAAAADLGAADVNINLGNTNGAFNTNLILDGSVTAGSFIGALTGNATTATTAAALAADPTDCGANTYTNAIAASGNLTCASITDAALSVNVTKLGATITKDELTGSGTLGFSWTDAEISNTLTASIFTGTGSTTDAVDLATAEISGVLADGNVADTLTIGASSTVADGALSVNVTKLGSSIQNAEVDDDLTVSASGSVADGALSVNVTKLGSAIDLATSEVSGQLKATNFQNSAADLGAADANINLSNSNGAFNTNLTIDGIVTASSFTGSLSGNATTATALTADPTDCGANTYANAIAANGNLTCTSITDAALSANVTKLGATITKDELTGSGTLGFTWDDSEVADTLTIGASSTVADAALSSNVTKLGATITKDELTGTGVLGFTWADSEVADTLTIGASSTVADGALSATITKLGTAIDLATNEVSGQLKATNLQNAGADLGAANVNIVLSNTNGAFVTNLTTDGTITATTFSGSLSGNASTATALAADPADCAADTYATTIAASGALTCSTVTKTGLANSGSLAFTWSDAEVSNTLTSSILVGSGSSTNAVDLATAEVAGNLRANNLQNAAADLGAADVSINLGNTNGSFNTNLALDGSVTTAGNINTTAGALQLNGADINTAGTLTNVAYENQANAFTVANSFTAAGTALSVTNNASIGGNLAVGSLRIGTSTTAGYVLTADASGNATWSAQTVQKVYNGTTLTSGNNIIWAGSATCTVTNCSLIISSDGTSGGTAIFTNIFSVQCTVQGVTNAATNHICGFGSWTVGTKTMILYKSTAGTTIANPALSAGTVYVTVIGN